MTPDGWKVPIKRAHWQIAGAFVVVLVVVVVASNKVNTIKATRSIKDNGSLLADRGLMTYSCQLAAWTSHHFAWDNESPIIPHSLVILWHYLAILSCSVCFSRESEPGRSSQSASQSVWTVSVPFHVSIHPFIDSILQINWTRSGHLFRRKLLP